MSKKVIDLAQVIQDDFYQSFKTEDGFFGIEDFALKIIDERDSALNEEFTVQWRIAQQKNNLYSFVLVNPQWQKRVTLDIKHDDERMFYYVEICEPIYEFPFDQVGMGIQEVSPLGQNCSEFVRITLGQGWQPCMVSGTSSVVFYAVENCKIILYNFNGYCTKKLDVRIVPSQSALPINQQTVPDGKAAEIREKVLSKMWRDYMAKKGQIKVTNDGNPNPEPNETGLTYGGLVTK